MDQSGAGKTKIGKLLCKEGYISFYAKRAILPKPISRMH